MVCLFARGAVILKVKCVYFAYTPQNKHGSPENGPLENEIPDLETIISRFHVNFLGCTLVFQIPCEDRCLDPQTPPNRRPEMGFQTPN